MIDLLIKYPTFSRPQQFKYCLEQWMQWLSKKKGLTYRFVITMEKSDLSMNNSQMIKYLEDKGKNYSCIQIRYYFGDYMTKINAVNAQMDKNMDFKFLIVCSDDMLPAKANFDCDILNYGNIKFPDTMGALHFSDGVNHTAGNLCTISCMGRKLFQWFGYIYYDGRADNGDAYFSVFSDTEYTDIIKRPIEGKLRYIFIKNPIIRHQWNGNAVSHKNDIIYRRNEQHWNHDKALYEKRKARGFPRK